VLVNWSFKSQIFTKSQYFKDYRLDFLRLPKRSSSRSEAEGKRHNKLADINSQESLPKEQQQAERNKQHSQPFEM